MIKNKPFHKTALLNPQNNAQTFKTFKFFIIFFSSKNLQCITNERCFTWIVIDISFSSKGDKKLKTIFWLIVPEFPSEYHKKLVHVSCAACPFSFHLSPPSREQITWELFAMHDMSTTFLSVMLANNKYSTILYSCRCDNAGYYYRKLTVDHRYKFIN